MEAVGKQMERNWKNWKGLEKLQGVEGLAVMRCRAGNARLIRQMVYSIWFSFGKLENMGVKMIFLLKIDGGIGKILKDVNKWLNKC